MVRAAARESFETYAQSARAAIDAELDRLLPAPPACPPLIAEAVRYSIFAGGKRLRPLLTLAAADSVCPAGMAPDDATVLPAACAVEMIHTYSLIHDDLPAMDDDTLRRGRPTAHVVYGEGIAVLAGDALLTEAFGVLARHPAAGGPHDDNLRVRKLRTIGRVAQAVGAEGMVGGQAIDLLATGKGAVSLDADGLRAMHAKKTGALIRAAAVAGATLGGADDDAVAAVDAYATHVGLAFQIVDDILDVEGVSEHLGKTKGKDAAADKPTYPALFGIDESRRLAARSVDAACAALDAAGIQGHLATIAERVLSRTR
ncbi:MAG: polyprenyl synthetase family protein [Acidobacteria bacterium]|nr:polyprenyl synthetase family protein [Acidobacteriota bacterium]